VEMIIKNTKSNREAQKVAQITHKYPHLYSVVPVKQGSSPPTSIPIVTPNLFYANYKIPGKKSEKVGGIVGSNLLSTNEAPWWSRTLTIR
jgi:hypothetical protein